MAKETTFPELSATSGAPPVAPEAEESDIATNPAIPAQRVIKRVAIACSLTPRKCFAF
jgi:hypothetical protein